MHSVATCKEDTHYGAFRRGKETYARKWGLKRGESVYLKGDVFSRTYDTPFFIKIISVQFHSHVHLHVNSSKQFQTILSDCQIVINDHFSINRRTRPTLCTYVSGTAILSVIILTNTLSSTHTPAQDNQEEEVVGILSVPSEEPMCARIPNYFGFDQIGAYWYVVKQSKHHLYHTIARIGQIVQLMQVYVTQKFCNVNCCSICYVQQSSKKSSLIQFQCY